MDRNMIDAASGGALLYKTTEQARQLIANMAANSQQFGTRANIHSMPTHKVNEASETTQHFQIFTYYFLQSFSKISQ